MCTRVKITRIETSYEYYDIAYTTINTKHKCEYSNTMPMRIIFAVERNGALMRPSSTTFLQNFVSKRKSCGYSDWWNKLQVGIDAPVELIGDGNLFEMQQLSSGQEAKVIQFSHLFIAPTSNCYQMKKVENFLFSLFICICGHDSL